MLGVTAIADGVSVGQGFALELLFTFMLVFFVVSITDPKKNPEPYGTTLGIGLIIVVSHVCIVSSYYNVKQKKCKLCLFRNSLHFVEIVDIRYFSVFGLNTERYFVSFRIQF